MRFFSRVVFICNCSFVLAVILRFVENTNKIEGSFSGQIESTSLGLLVVMGYGAVFANFIFNIFLLTSWLSKSKQKITKWLIWVNFLFLIVQICYFWI